MSTYHITFTTPLFSRGAYEDRPEIRAASIRGQLHWWLRALGGNATDEKAIFGGVHGDASASKVVIRVSQLPAASKRVQVATLPHKVGGQASPKWAIPVGESFALHVLQRLGGLPANLNGTFQKSLDTWLFLGTLGLRATRGAGSFVWVATDPGPLYPKDFAEYEEQGRMLVQGTAIRFALLAETYPSGEAARRVVSDTLGGRDDHSGQDDLRILHDPLGRIGHSGRKTSPLRFRIVRIGDQYRIAAVWDGRNQVTGNQPSDLAGVITLLAARKPRLGEQLKQSSLVT